MLLRLALVVAFAAGGCTCGVVSERQGTPTGTVVHAIRAVKPPVLDGRLDDPCWRNAQEISGFVAYGTTNPAQRQSLGYVCFDDQNLYIGMKCLMPAGAKPIGELRPGHDAAIFGGDDIVEIMVDPGKSGTDYFQFCTNAYGARYDTARHGGGSVADAKWNGDWQAAGHIDEGYWTIEVAIPYYVMGITSQTGATWGLNLCRDAAMSGSFELSSILRNGNFNAAPDFVTLEGITADFHQFAMQIGAPKAQLTLGEPPQLALNVPITNSTGKNRGVRIDRHFVEAGAEKTASSSVTLRRDEIFILPIGTVGVEDVLDRGNEVYYRAALPQTHTIVVKDEANGAFLSSSPVSQTIHRAMALTVNPAWHPNMTNKATEAVTARVTVDIADTQRRAGSLRVTLVAKESDQGFAEKTFAAPEETTDVCFPATGIPWGAYEMRAVLFDQTGKKLLAAHAPALILPGGKQQIRVLNNFVSELMNAKERDLLDAGEIPFMNPRDGWCFFALQGGAQIRLDGAADPILPVAAWGNPNEAMRYLKAGRHTLSVTCSEGAKLEQVVVRSIPALLFDYYGSVPPLAGFGPWDWEFMGKHILPHINTMIDAGVPREPGHIEMWKKIGRSWIAQTGRLDIDALQLDPASPDAADKVCKVWEQSPGYQHPLMDGVICDEFTTSNDPIYDVYTRAVEKLNAKFPNRTFSPYNAWIWGLDKSGKLAQASISGGGYCAPEYYLEAMSGRATAEGNIRRTLTQAVRKWNEHMPGVNPRVIVVPSYFSSGSMCSDVSDGNYRVFMDMEIQALATDPGCFGLGGLLWYRSSYTDREYVRWAAQLFRHYGIEGHTESATQEPYELTHVKNPEFAAGAEGWDFQQAEEGAIRCGSFPGYGFAEGRYFYRSTVGDTFLITKRSAKGPNIVRQEMKDLTPGKLYSLRMITGDYGDLVKGSSQRQLHAISITFDGAEVLEGPRNSFQNAYVGTGSWKQSGKFFAQENPLWVNFHWRVFRAKGKTATLVLSDWSSGKEPGGPTGQELIYNFVKVQPYFAE